MGSNVDPHVQKNILVPEEDWIRLKKLEADLPSIIDRVRNETTKERLASLHQKQKENPEKHREQSKKRYELKKEEIKAKRREAYRLKKEAKLVANSPGSSSGAPEISPTP